MKYKLNSNLSLFILAPFLASCATGEGDIAGALAGRSSEKFITPDQDKVELIANGVELFDGPYEGEYSSLGEITGLTCIRNAHKTKLSLNKVKNNLKQNAKEKGANAVINVACEIDPKTDWKKNCWAKGICTGEGVITK